MSDPLFKTDELVATGVSLEQGSEHGDVFNFPFELVCGIELISFAVAFISLIDIWLVIVDFLVLNVLFVSIGGCGLLGCVCHFVS